MNMRITTVFFLCLLLLSAAGCAQGPRPSSLRFAYEDCKDGGGRECFEKKLGPADYVGPTKNEGEIYMRWFSSPRTIIAWSVFQRDECWTSGPCKLEISLKGTELTGWLFTGTCPDEILDKSQAEAEYWKMYWEEHRFPSK